MERPLALVVDADPAVRAEIARALREAGMETAEAGGGAEAQEALRSRAVGLVVADPSSLPPTGGRGRAGSLRIDLVPSRDPAALRAALEGGADDVLARPVSADEVRLAAARARRRLESLAELQALREETRMRTGFDRLVGRSEAMQRLRDRVERAAAGDGGVLLVGESGSGRETAARTFHALSPRSDRPFVKFDAASGPSAEEELLGSGGRSGLLAEADGGTLYLHEVDALPGPVQERLARALREGLHRPAGNGEPARVARGGGGQAGVDPQRAASEGRLVPDLRALLPTSIEVPPLRSRPEDVPLLARHVVETIRRMNDLGPIRLSPEAAEMIAAHAWPGNVRELRHALEQAVILAEDGTIRPRDLPEKLRRPEGAARGGGERPRGGDPGRFRERKRVVVEAFERAYLQDLLQMHGGNVTAAAAHAGMLRSALQRLLRKYALRSADYRPARAPAASAEPM